RSKHGSLLASQRASAVPPIEARKTRENAARTVDAIASSAPRVHREHQKSIRSHSAEVALGAALASFMGMMARVAIFSVLGALALGIACGESHPDAGSSSGFTPPSIGGSADAGALGDSGETPVARFQATLAQLNQTIANNASAYGSIDTI